MKRPSFLRAKFGLVVLALATLLVAAGTTNCNQPDTTSEVRDDGHPSELPIVIADSLIKPLRSLANDELQSKLDAIISSNKKLAALAKSNRVSIGLVDLRNTNDVKYASINGELMLYAASLPKIAVLLAATDAIDKGELEESQEVKSDMRLMIAKSNNAATTRMIDRVGFDKIAEVMQDPNYELYDPEFGGGLWVGKRYAAEGVRKGDPLKNLSHAASATQVCRYYYLLAHGKLVNFERSKQMLGYLGDPELHHKFVNTLDRVAPKAKVFRKSGSWKQYHSDSALVWGPSWRRYILVALVEDEEGEKIMRNLMLEVDQKMKPTE